MAKGPKVEVRSRTGRNYNRGGATWTTEWASLNEKDFTKEQLKLIAEDPHLDLRVDGERVRKSAEGVPHDPDLKNAVASADRVARLEAKCAQFELENASLIETSTQEGSRHAAEVDALNKAIAASKAESASLQAKVTTLEIAAKAATTLVAPSKPTA